MEMGEKAGKVSKGCTPDQIRRIKAQFWSTGQTKTEECLICMEEFKTGKKFKRLQCGHEYDSACIDKWLATEKRCPVCSENVC